MIEINQIHLGDCINLLKKIPEKTIDCIVTDPPYGYSFADQNWDNFKLSRITKSQVVTHLGAGMKRTSLSENQNYQQWVTEWGKEAIRVLQPGALMFYCMTPRQDLLSRAIVGLEDAGFDIAFSSIYWTYSSGFPKAINTVRVAMKKLGDPGIEVRKKTIGLGIQKGSILEEKIILEPTIPEIKELKGSKLGFQLKPAVEVIIVAMKPIEEKTYVEQALKNHKGIFWEYNCRLNGRFPANLLVSDKILDQGNEKEKLGKPYEYRGRKYLVKGFIKNNSPKSPSNYNDAGGYSRFFDLDSWWESKLPFLIVPKVQREERGDSDHPTMKSLKLMSYLITMGSKERDIILDPFAGSGTTLVAAKYLKRNFIGIEINNEYIKIAERRLKYEHIPQ